MSPSARGLGELVGPMVTVRANGLGHQVAPDRTEAAASPSMDLDDDGPSGGMSGLEKDKVLLGRV